MEIGRIVGTVVASQKDPSLKGIKLHFVQPLHEDLSDNGEALVMANDMQAGLGELVWFVLGREAALALSETFTPVDFAVVGIVDRVDIDIPARREKSS